jgi:RsiW-degrading membrane proteinase PrsW (M82 family)
VAVVLNTVGEAVVSEQLGAEVGQLYGYSISAPIVEEGIKAAVLFGLFLFFRREFNGVIDGIVYAGCVGLGFAMTENVLYYGRGAPRRASSARSGRSSSAGSCRPSPTRSSRR